MRRTQPSLVEGKEGPSQVILPSKRRITTEYTRLPLLLLMCTAFALSILKFSSVQKFAEYASLMKEKEVGDEDDGSFFANKRVVILGGPHKTGSTSLQFNMYEWTRTGILKNWTWPTPTNKQFSELGFPPDKEGPKGFAPLMWKLRGNEHYSNISKSKIMNMYSNALSKAWVAGSNIVMGAEAIDVVTDTTTERVNGTRIVEDIISLMPWENENLEGSTKENVVVVVSHRQPRVKHLVSVWHQYGPNVGPEGEALSSFLKTHMKRFFFQMNGLGLASKFAEEHGLDTAIVDLSGLARDGMDLSTSVACNILKAPCLADGSIVGLDELPQVRNVKPDPGKLDLDDATLDAIDGILLEYDCKFQHLAAAKNVHILHRNDLFQSCTPNMNPDVTVETVVQAIIDTSG